MKDSSKGWIAGLIFLLLIVAVPVWIFTRDAAPAEPRDTDQPWEGVPRRPAHVDHSSLFNEPFETSR
jgi:hypothetical protein